MVKQHTTLWHTLDEQTHKENNSIIIRWEMLLVPTLQLLWDHLGLKMILQLNRPTGYIKGQEKKRHQTLEIKSCQEDIRKTNDMKKEWEKQDKVEQRKEKRQRNINDLVQFVILFRIFFTAILTSLFLRL